MYDDRHVDSNPFNGLERRVGTHAREAGHTLLGIHSMELKAHILSACSAPARPANPNPFNGIESFFPCFPSCFYFLSMNPFNGIES